MWLEINVCMICVHHHSNRPGRVANAEIELYPILATAAPCIYLGLAIANKELYTLEPYPWIHSAQKEYLAWSRLACMLRSRCLPPSLRSAPSSKLSPLYASVIPVSRAKRCKPCPVTLVPTPGCSRPLPPTSSGWHPICPEIPECVFWFK